MSLTAEPAPAVRSGGRSVTWIGWVVWVVVSLGFLGFLATGVLGERGTTILDDYGSVLAPLVAAIGCWRASRREVGSWRRGWALLGLALLSWSVGSMIWTIYEVHLGREMPYPSAADGAYLLVGPFAVAALLRMGVTRGPRRAEQLRPLLDGTIAATAIFMVSWATVLGPTVRYGEGSTFARLIGVAYPAVDLLTATIALLAVSRARGARRVTLILIGVGMLAAALSDSLFLWLTARGDYGSGNLIDSGWVAGFLLIGLASLRPAGEVDDQAGDRVVSAIELAVPYAPFAIAAPFAVVWQLSGRPMDPVLFYDGVLLVLLILGRQLIVLRTNVALSHQLEDTVTALREREGELRHQAFHDPLTGLANRALFTDRVAHSLARMRRRLPVSVLLADLDDFKLVNDTLGHQAGDTLLAAVAERLRASVRPGDTVARLGGDEFAVLIEDTESPAEAAEVAERIAQALEHPFALNGNDVIVRASIGVTVSDLRADGEGLLRDADAAMYEAKRQGKGRYAMFEPTLVAASLQRLRLKTDLTVALERGQLHLHYQPIVTVSTGEVTGFEALLRWDHPEFGRIPPDLFIPLAEDNGSILPIGRWVLTLACADAARWQALRPAGTSPLKMAVNVSAMQLTDPELLPTVTATLRGAGMAPRLLTLEITESTLLSDREQAIARLRALREVGVRIAIDDFGTGYSGMSRLRDYPITTLKVDKTFISALGPPRGHGGDQATLLMASIQQLGSGLGLHLIAEGVETEDQLEALQALGYGEAQGYLFSRPVEPGVIEDLVRAGLPLGPALDAAAVRPVQTG